MCLISVLRRPSRALLVTSAGCVLCVVCCGCVASCLLPCVSCVVCCVVCGVLCFVVCCVLRVLLWCVVCCVLCCAGPSSREPFGEPFGSHLGAIWSHLGAIWEVIWEPFGRRSRGRSPGSDLPSSHQLFELHFRSPNTPTRGQMGHRFWVLEKGSDSTDWS